MDGNIIAQTLAELDEQSLIRQIEECGGGLRGAAAANDPRR